ncbi:F-box/FBD/LRR-repeat protein At1g51370-like isoform X1 [Primulina huaijiensis]|uniref:F-box/FBD/LRR-repeat protein At1g51370-like isoform X1 n=1 Tax=Primulina huaijiensis TaxID=1492673 RepID=UPI003CC6E6E5
MHNVFGLPNSPLLAKVACFALVCVGFSALSWDGWFSTTRRPVKRFSVDKQKGFDIDIEAEERKDRISQLPDHIISSIISRLGTKAAVRTSILSKRWRQVYTLIHEVRFFCSDMHGGYGSHHTLMGKELIQRKFAEGVDTFLQHHSCSKILSFKLFCCFRGCILDTFRKWMNSVGTMGVEKLTIGFCSLHDLRGNGLPVFSTDFLTEASSVKHLFLRGGSFLIPNKNSLQVLELDFIAFTSEAVQCMLSNCSSLQSLSLRFCALPSKLLIHGLDLQLKSMTIYDCKFVEEIDLSAINLINFEIYSASILKLSFSHVPLLQTLVIEFYGSEVTPYVFGKIAKDVPHLESMVFTSYASFFEGRKLDRVISKLSNLRHLVLILRYHNKLDLSELVVFLDACPLLLKLQLSMVVTSTFNPKQARERMVRRDTRLKEVEFNGFRGKGCEYNFILYILKTVASLERLILSSSAVTYQMCLRRWMAATNAEKHQISHKWLQGQALSKNVEIITL